MNLARSSLWLGIHCAVLEILWLNSNSHCTSQLFMIKSQSSFLLCSHYKVQLSSHNLSTPTVRVKMTHGLLLSPAWLLTIVNKD